MNPIPQATRGPVVTQPQDTEFKTEAGNPVLPENAGQNVISWSDLVSVTGSTQTITLYTVPAGKSLLVGRAFFSIQGPANTYNYCAVLAGASSVAEAYVYVNVAQDLAQSGNLVIPAGVALKVKIGGNGAGVTASTYSLQGYLSEVSTAPAPVEAQIDEPGIG